nr:cell adhesion molecule Dscam2-like [Cherax quadricarinatus]
MEEEITVHKPNYLFSSVKNDVLSYVVSTITSVPPSWVVEPQDVAVIGGEEVALECHAQGTPPPIVTWKRTTDGGGTEESSALVGDGWRLQTPLAGSLRIRDARAEDSGRYLCHANNGVNPAISKTISLSVLEGARIEERVVNESVAVGESLALRCAARGDLPLAFTWARDAAPIPGGGSSEMEVRMEEAGKVSVLMITSISRAHAAVYTCQASNRYGADSRTFFVNVVDVRRLNKTYKYGHRRSVIQTFEILREVIPEKYKFGSYLHHL